MNFYMVRSLPIIIFELLVPYVLFLHLNTIVINLLLEELLVFFWGTLMARRHIRSMTSFPSKWSPLEIFVSMSPTFPFITLPNPLLLLLYLHLFSYIMIIFLLLLFPFHLLPLPPLPLLPHYFLILLLPPLLLLLLHLLLVTLLHFLLFLQMLLFLL